MEDKTKINADDKLLNYCRYIITVQILSPLSLFGVGILTENSNYFGEAIFVHLLIFFLVCIPVIFMIQAICPACSNLFFARKFLMNIGFSMYTHKCANCGYKLKRSIKTWTENYSCIKLFRNKSLDIKHWILRIKAPSTHNAQFANVFHFCIKFTEGHRSTYGCFCRFI